MKKLKSSLLLLALLAPAAAAQPPEGDRGQGGPGGPGQREGREGREGRGQRGEGASGGNVEGAVARLMTVDRNQDGSITEDEYQDSRLRPLLERADANKDKIITKDELTAQLTKEAAARGTAPGGPGFPGGPGGPGGREFGEMGRGRGPMMRPGLVMPEFMMNELQLSAEQRAALAKLQETVDAELKKILTAEQQQRMAQPAPGFGGPGGPGMRGRGGRPEGEFEGGQEGRPRPEGGRGERPEGERGEGDRGERPEGGRGERSERPERPA